MSRENSWSRALGGESFPDRPREWEPRSAVVLAALSGGGPSASYCSPYVNFASSRERAEALLEQSAVTRGEIIEMDDAIEFGKRIFGNLLND